MIGNGHIGGYRAFARPILELRVQGGQLGDVVPNRFERSLNDFAGQRFVTDEVNVVGEDASVADYASG